MTAAKIEGKPGSSAAAALEPHVQRLYAKLGTRVVGVFELKAAGRNQVAADEDKEPSVSLRLTHLEVANPEQEGAVREALRALFLHRTAQGKLTEDGDIELTKGTLEMTGGLLHAIEAARLRAALSHWADYARRVANDSRLTQAQIRHELDTVADGLGVVLRAEKPEQNGG
jgi:hypothetical protein